MLRYDCFGGDGSLLQVHSRQVVLAVLLGLGAAAKLDGLTPHHGHDHQPEDHHHHEDHHSQEDQHLHEEQHHHSHTGDADRAPNWNPLDIYRQTHSDAANTINGALEERFNIQAGSIRHQEFAEAKPDDAMAVRGSYS